MLIWSTWPTQRGSYQAEPKMSRACVLSHQCCSAAVLLCTRPASCVSSFTVSTTADTLGMSPPVTNDNCLTVTYMRPRPICLEGPGAASIPWRQVMAATQPPPRDVSSIADIDDMIAPSQIPCSSKSQMVLATQPHPKMFLLKRPRYHGRVHLSWCISDVSSIADVGDIVIPWRDSWSGGRQTLTSRWLFYMLTMPLPPPRCHGREHPRGNSRWCCWHPPSPMSHMSPILRNTLDVPYLIPTQMLWRVMSRMSYCLPESELVRNFISSANLHNPININS